MPLLDRTAAYIKLEKDLLDGMNDARELTYMEKILLPQKYSETGSDHENVHEIPLEADLSTWNKGAWFILKPRFFSDMARSNKAELNAIVASLLKSNHITVNLNIKMVRNALIDNTNNDLVFSAFIMMKIMAEKLSYAQPEQTRGLSQYEQALVKSLWAQPFWSSAMKQEQDVETAFGSTVGLVFASLQEIIARVAIHSSLQNIALRQWMVLNLVDEKELLMAQGLCDLNSNDLDTMAELLCALPEAEQVYNWLVKQNSPLTQTISQLLGAILEKPKNVDKFLRALNLQQGTAKSKIDEIAEQKRSTEQKDALEKPITEISSPPEPTHVLEKPTSEISSLPELQNALEEPKGEIISLLAELNLIQANLAQKASISSRYKKISQAVQTLYGSLDTHMNEFFKSPTPATFELFKSQCEQALLQVESEAKKHRGWHRIHSILKAILGVLAAIAVIPALIVEKKSKQGYIQTFFTKPETETSKKMTTFKTAFNERLSSIKDKLPKK